MILVKFTYNANVCTGCQTAKIISILIFTEVIGSNVIIGGVDDEAVGGKEKPFPQIGAKRSHHQIPTKVTSTHDHTSKRTDR